MDQLCRLLMADVSKRLGRIEPVELWTTDHRGEAVTP